MKRFNPLYFILLFLGICLIISNEIELNKAVQVNQNGLENIYTLQLNSNVKDRYLLAEVEFESDIWNNIQYPLFCYKAVKRPSIDFTITDDFKKKISVHADAADLAGYNNM